MFGEKEAYLQNKKKENILIILLSLRLNYIHRFYKHVRFDYGSTELNWNTPNLGYDTATFLWHLKKGAKKTAEIVDDAMLVSLQFCFSELRQIPHFHT